MPHFRELKTSLFACDRNIAERGQRAAKTDGSPLNNTDDRYLGAAKGIVQIENNFHLAPHLIGFRERATPPHSLAAETKLIACTPE